MEKDENRAALASHVQAFNAGDHEAYLSLYDEHVIHHDFDPNLPQGKAGLAAFYAGFWEAFPAGKISVDNVIAVGPYVAVRFTFSGEHGGSLMGLQATGKQVSVTGETLFRFAAGKCVERWEDSTCLPIILGQLGIKPPSAG